MVIDVTSLSKNHKSVGPVIIRIPNAIVTIPEYRGKIASTVFSFSIQSSFASVGKITKLKKIMPPIHTDANKLCT